MSPRRTSHKKEKQLYALILLLVSLIAGIVISSHDPAPDFAAPPSRPPELSPSSENEDNTARLASAYEDHWFLVLENYCYDCHMDTRDKGGVDLDEFPSLAEVKSDPQLWSRLRTQIELGLMPPPNKEQPSQEERDGLLAWIDQAVFPVDPENPDPGPTPWRRLNRVEYANTIKAIFDLEFPTREWLPPDDASGGFDTIANGKVLTEARLRSYLRAAEAVLDQTLVIGPAAFPNLESDIQKWYGDGRQVGEHYVLPSRGMVSREQKIEHQGRYRVEFDVAAQQAGPELARAAFWINGKRTEEQEIAARQNQSNTFSFEWHAERGRQVVSVQFLNDYYLAGKNGRRSQDRNLIIKDIRISGPIDKGEPAKPDSHVRIFGQRHQDEGDQSYARRILSRFAKRAFGRPVTSDEITPYLEFLEKTENRENAFDEGIRLALLAMMVSPDFLIRGETSGESLAHGRAPLSQASLARRLSYWLWSGPPDPSLIDRVQNEQLRGKFDEEVSRMLADPKAAALTKNFAGQWLALRNMEWLRPDRKRYPQADEQLIKDMKKETERFFEYIILQNRPVGEFISADYGFMNKRLADHYQIADLTWEGDEWRRVKLPENRRGLVTQGSILALNAEPDRSSPVLRGKFVLEALLDQAPPPPPGDIPPLEESEQNHGKLSHREQLELHRRSPDCAACHKLMDPIGFALENFDVTGVWRDTDGGHPIDSATTLASGEELLGATDLLNWLANTQKETFIRCFIKKMLSYAIGRELQYFDEVAVDQILEETAENQYRSHDIILAISRSIPFQQKRNPTPNPHQVNTTP